MKILAMFFLSLTFLQVGAQYSVELLDSPAKVKNIRPIQYYGYDPYHSMEINTLNVTKGYQNEGLSALLIDKKIATRAPYPFDFLHINLATKAVTRIPVIKGNDPALPQTAMGQINTPRWSHNGKLFVPTTEPSFLVSFDPYTNTAHDYGNVFGNGVQCANISIGKDSAVYGVSSALNGKIYTFRLDPVTDAIQINSICDSESFMGIGVQGDARYTYVITGRDGSRVYSIDRTNGVVDTLLSSSTVFTHASTTIENYHDTLSFVFNNANYMFENGGATLLASRPFVPYPFEAITYPAAVNPDTINYPLVGYNLATDSVFWKFRNSSTEESIKISPTISTVNIGGLYQVKSDSLIIFGPQYSTFAVYKISSDTYSKSINTESIYCGFVKDNKFYNCAYPSGQITIFDPALPPNIYRNSFLFDPVNETDTNANPRFIGNVYSEGVAPQVVVALNLLQDSIFAYAGNINSDCTRKGDGAGIGYITMSGRKVLVNDPFLLNYEIRGSALGDNHFPYYSTTMYPCKEMDASLNACIIKHNVLGNKIEKIIPFPAKDAGLLTKGMDNQIVGYTSLSTPSTIYFLSEVSDEIYKTINLPLYLLAVHLGYDNKLWVFAKTSATSYKFIKMDPYSGEYTTMFSFDDSTDQSYNDFMFVNQTDVYLSGTETKRLARIRGLVTPVSNSYLSNYDKLNGRFNFQICD